jgi:hypothetical protein
MAMAFSRTLRALAADHPRPATGGRPPGELAGLVLPRRTHVPCGHRPRPAGSGAGGSAQDRGPVPAAGRPGVGPARTVGPDAHPRVPLAPIRQRVQFGRGLLRPGVRLAILDEPFRGLDRERCRELLDRARRWWREATLLCVTHDVGETLTFDRVLVIERGRLVEDGAPTVLARQPNSRYRALLDAEETVRTRVVVAGKLAPAPARSGTVG